MDSNLDLDEYIDFEKYWLVLKRRWIPATVTFACILVGANIWSSSLPQMYETEAKLLIKANRSARLTGLENSTGEIRSSGINSDPLATEAQIVRSRPIIEKIIKELDLRNDGGKLLKYGAVARDIEVKSIRGTDILSLTYANEDPELAALIVNKLVELYIEDHTLNNRSETTSAREFISKQLPKVEANVREAETNLSHFKKQNRIANLEQEITTNIAALSNIADQIDRAEADLEDITARYNRLQTQLDMTWQEASAVSALSQSLAVQRFLDQLQEVKLTLAQKRNYLSDNAPQIIALKEEEADLTTLLDRQIAKTLDGEQQAIVKKINILSLGQLKQSQIADFASLGLEKEGLEKKQRVLQNTYNSYKQKSDILPMLQKQQRELERRVLAAESTYQTLLSKLQETQITEQQNIGNVRVVSDALTPEAPIASKKPLIMAAAGVAGALLGVAVAFLIDIRDKKIKNTQEIEEMLPYPLQGIVPDFKKITAKKQLLFPNNSTANLPKFADIDISAQLLREAYNNIQINLKLLDNEAVNKVIAVTSSVSGEGKSSVSANLAMAKAQCGQKVLIIDGDLRSPSQQDIWGVSNEIGLTEVLKQEVIWQQAIQNVMPNLDIMASGPRVKNPVSLLDFSLLEALITSASCYYDLILFDAPPLVGLADTRILAMLVDGLLFVVRPGVANYTSIAEAKKLLTTFNVLGVVANGVNFDREAKDRGYFYLRKSDKKRRLSSRSEGFKNSSLN